jgi:hypothetical protein
VIYVNGRRRKRRRRRREEEKKKRRRKRVRSTKYRYTGREACTVKTKIHNISD